MDSVADERSRLRQHVRAAREWLGRAEASLDRAEDVRGDLNLMLAQAELMRAKETERPSASVVWARRVAPLCAAALLAGIGLWAWRAGVPPAQEFPAGERRIEQRAETATAGIAEASQKEIELLPIAPQEETVPADSPVEPQPLAMEMERQESEPVVVPQEAEAPPDVPVAQETRLPSEDMQRLMNSAGQSLRAIK